MPNQPTDKTKIFFGKIIRTLITLIALFWIFKTVNFENILLTIKNTNLRYVLLASILFQISVFIRTYRWKILLQSTLPSVSYSTLLMLNYSGSFFDVFLPTGFGGDIIRTFELNKADNKTSIVDNAGIVLLDRFAGFTALFTICIAALPFAISFIPKQLAIWIATIAISGLVSATILITNVGVKSLVKLLNRFSFMQGLSTYILKIASITKKRLLNAWFVSLFFHLIIIGVHYSLSLALHSNISIIVFFVFTPVVALTLLLPSIRGLGLRENTYEYLLSQVGAPEAMGVALGLLIFSVKIITGLIGGMVYLYYTITKKKFDTKDHNDS